MIQLKPTNLIAVEVPEKNRKYNIWWVNPTELLTGSWLINIDYQTNVILSENKSDVFKILGEVTKEGVQFDGEPYIGIHIVNKTKYYYNYLPFEGMDFRDIIDNSFKTSQESFQSLLQANNIEIPEGKKLLILLKQ